jgi:predicted metal-dependent phosphoesterase TrpH
MIILKKIDFHVHTIETSLDGKSNVKFDVNVLEKYIKDLRIDAIAITNHNIFDMEQYNQIVSRISSTKIFPGIEISLDTGHILVISPEEDLIEFDMECTKITNHFLNNNSISVDEFKKVFTKLDKYLLIPHYDKKPIIKYSVIKMLEKHIFLWRGSKPKKI